MLSSEKAFIQAYNAQLAVDAETQIAVAAELSNQEARAPHLIPVLDQVKQNTGRRSKEVSADAGYFSEKNLEELARR
jgi:hypothetical protein